MCAKFLNRNINANPKNTKAGIATLGRARSLVAGPQGMEKEANPQPARKILTVLNSAAFLTTPRTCNP